MKPTKTPEPEEQQAFYTPGMEATAAEPETSIPDDPDAVIPLQTAADEPGDLTGPPADRRALPSEHRRCTASIGGDQ